MQSRDRIPGQAEPYHNYPRSLRELALKAGKEGIREAQAEYRAAMAESQAQIEDRREIDAANMESFQSSAQAQNASSRWSRPKPPSKEDLLKIAQGFWTRLRIRFKWFTIRGFRRFNADDFSAFFTLGGLGTAVFVIVGTTTFVSLVFAALNALNMQGWIARKLADYLTSETGVTVIFESAIVPKWKESRICFQNVFISRRAYDNDAETLRKERRKSRRRYMTAAAAGQGMAWEGTHYSEYDDEEVAPPMSDSARGRDIEDIVDSGVHTNFSMFDLNVDSIEVTLSFRRWWDGKGLVEDAVVEGVRGIVDRRNVFWDPDQPYDPRAARRKHKYGDFELDSLIVKDFLVTVYQPGNFRPFNLSIFDASIPRLRKQWLFYDLLGADRFTGQFDGCLFSLHKPQSIGKTIGREKEMTTGRWKTLSRLRIDGVNFDHIQNQSDVYGPVSWVVSGKFDVVADIKLPKEASDDIDINIIISELLDSLSQAVTGDGRSEIVDAPIPGQHRLSGPAIEAPVTTVGPAAEGAWRQKEIELEKLKAETSGRGWRGEMEAAAYEANRLRHGKKETTIEEVDETKLEKKEMDETKLEKEEAAEDTQVASEPIHPSTDTGRQNDSVNTMSASSAASVVIDLDVRFKDIKAAVPLFSSDLTYRTQTYVRPIVAFMNANHTLIPVHSRIVMDLGEFDGAMDLAQTGLLPVVSEKIYEALANHVQSQRANNQRFRSVSQWWIRLATDQILQYVLLVRDTLVHSRATSHTPQDHSPLTLDHHSGSVS